MATVITKRGNGVPTAASLTEGEQAVDLLTGRIYTLSGGVVIECGVDAHDMDFHTDVDTSTTPPADGEVLSWDGAINTWVPMPAPSGGGGSSTSGGIDTPTIYSPTGSALLSLDTSLTTFVAADAYIATAGAVHQSSEWVIYDNSSFTNVVYSSGPVTGTQKTSITGITGLVGDATHWIAVRFTDSFGNVSSYSVPLEFYTTPNTVVLYEHGVNSVPAIAGDIITLDTGWVLDWTATFFDGGSGTDPYTHENLLTLNANPTQPQTTDQLLMRFITTNVQSTPYGPPTVLSEWNWKFDIASTLAHPNFDPTLRKFIDKNDPAFSPTNGFRWEFYVWQNMSSGGMAYPGQVASYATRENNSGGTMDQAYYSADGLTSDTIVNGAPQSGQVISRYDGSAAATSSDTQWDWKISDISQTNPPRGFNLSFLPPNGWRYALKKLEIIVP